MIDYSSIGTPRLVPLDFGYAGGRVYAGPYRSVYRSSEISNRALLINMAAEIRQPADITIPTHDFGVPPDGIFRHALFKAGRQLLSGGIVFVGCGYGIGRTGVFLAALCKVNRELLYVLRRGRELGDDAKRDPVEEVRALYLPAAVETEAQACFVRGLGVRTITRRLAVREKPAVLFDNRFWGL